jgi:hypothetical protein
MSDKAIVVKAQESGEPLSFVVFLRKGPGQTRHEVTLSAEDHARLGEGYDAATLVEAAFEFLLNREPKEAILGRFDISEISRYFPDFESELPRYLDAVS